MLLRHQKMLPQSSKGKSPSNATPFLLKNNFMKNDKQIPAPKPKNSSNHFYYGKKGIADTLKEKHFVFKSPVKKLHTSKSISKKLKSNILP